MVLLYLQLNVFINAQSKKKKFDIKPEIRTVMFYNLRLHQFSLEIFRFRLKKSIPAYSSIGDSSAGRLTLLARLEALFLCLASILCNSNLFLISWDLQNLIMTCITFILITLLPDHLLSSASFFRWHEGDSNLLCWTNSTVANPLTWFVHTFQCVAFAHLISFAVF